ncbi:acidic leucine-rich nuclear phosphoprotein 32 family member A-like [Cucumis melo var. makuwa]|uniref:Acidic leucine-rich nuclear phosphoprotein 32 family member A-like n=1 Tax=Cucumis melo var. makuwa TaxID=1194695 RepID=A0A5A7TCH8_CUCMM|nr:acidic leucine-rich nuclear phosphoprotein 32 family member A-like [Cucumis melo var. makuwa]TYK25978.1 acidic leucine-rich nuclear phosphoprotein 32 family member A-like [Cucumis melo var. makuwa]
MDTSWVGWDFIRQNLILNTTQNSGLMVIGKSDASESGENNFYCVLDEVLHVQYPLGRNVWLFKCRWYDTNVNKSQRTHVELGYKSLNTSRFWYAEEPVILATQEHQVFYLDDPKNGSNWKVVQIVQNKRIWDVPEVDDVENEHLNILEIVVSHQVDEHIQDDTLYRTDVDPTIVERLVVCYVSDDFIDDVDEHLSHASDDDKL